LSLKVLSYKGNCGRLRLYFLQYFQHTSFLANPGDVFHHTVLHHNEETDQGNKKEGLLLASELEIFQFNFSAHDPLQIYSIHIWKAKIPRERVSISDG